MPRVRSPQSAASGAQRRSGAPPNQEGGWGGWGLLHAARAERLGLEGSGAGLVDIIRNLTSGLRH